MRMNSILLLLSLRNFNQDWRSSRCWKERKVERKSKVCQRGRAGCHPCTGENWCYVSRQPCQGGEYWRQKEVGRGLNPGGRTPAVRGDGWEQNYLSWMNWVGPETIQDGSGWFQEKIVWYSVKSYTHIKERMRRERRPESAAMRRSIVIFRTADWLLLWGRKTIVRKSGGL